MCKQCVLDSYFALTPFLRALGTRVESTCAAFTQGGYTSAMVHNVLTPCIFDEVLLFTMYSVGIVSGEEYFCLYGY